MDCVWHAGYEVRALRGPPRRQLGGAVDVQLDVTEVVSEVGVHKARRGLFKRKFESLIDQIVPF